jgi:hypothetical protein
MTRATAVFTLLLLVPATPSTVVGQVAKKESPVRGSRLKEGDLVRINYVTFRMPDKLVIFPTLEQFQRHVRERAAETKTRRVNSLEGRLYVGHNTPASIDHLDSFSVAGQEFQCAQITFSSGSLRGQKYWVSLDRLRGAREPDSAEKLISEASTLLASPPPIDPDYEPQVGDSVVLAYRTLYAPSLDVSDQNGFEKKSNKWKFPSVYMEPIEPAVTENTEAAPPREIGCYAATTSGTKAVVELVTERHVKARITSGPFEGQRWFTLKTNVCRPEVYAEVKSQPSMVTKQPKPAMVRTEAKPAAPTKKRSVRRSAQAAPLPPDTKLVLTDLVLNPSASGNLVNVSARFRNTSDAPLKGTLVTISFEDRDGRLIRSQTAFCMPDTIDAGGIGSFEAIAENDARIAGAKLDFKTLEKSIPWVDRSGKDAHQ